MTELSDPMTAGAITTPDKPAYRLTEGAEPDPILVEII